jgi:hypothetical protein
MPSIPDIENEEDPIVARLTAETNARNSRLQGQLHTAVDTNPDQYAGQRRVAEQLGYPDAVIEARPDLVKQARIQQINQSVASSPILKQKLADDAAFAKLAHDDTGNLSKVEGAVNFLGSSLKAGTLDLMGAGAKLIDAVQPFTLSEGDAAVLYKNDPKKLQDMQMNSPSMFLSRFAKAMTEGSNQTMEDISPSAKQQYGDLQYQTLDPNKAAYLHPVKVIGDALRSLPTTAALALTIYLTRGAAAEADAQAIAAGLTAAEAKTAAIAAATKTATLVGATSEGAIGYAQQANQTAQDAAAVTDETLAQSPKYQELLASGFTHETAKAKLVADTAEQSGIFAGIVDAAVNAVGGHFLGKIIGEGGGIVKSAAKGLVNEGATEFVQSAGEQLGENASLKANVDPTQSLSKGVVESALQGLFVGGLTGGALNGIHGVANRFEEKKRDAEQALQHRDALTQLDKLSSESLLRARDPATFQQFIASAAQDGPVQDVYIDAKALAESGTADQLAQVSPSVREQFNEAVSTGGSVRIPLDEYTANIAGTQLNQPLLEHLKTDPNGMTFAESKEYAKTYQEDFNAELDKVTQEHTGDEAFKASASTVQNEILKQLNETGRYTPEVNDANAMVASAHFAVRAAQLGMTPEDLYKLRPLKVNGEPILGDIYSQGGALQTDTPQFKNWFGDSKIVDGEGKPVVMYHGTDKNFTTVNMKKGAQNVFWVTSNKAAIEKGEIGAAGNGKIIDMYAAIKNPAGWKEYDQLSLDEIESRGYDGVVLPNNDGTFEAIIFHPNQVKSASKNNGNFDPTNSNMLKQSPIASSPSKLQTDTPEFKTWFADSKMIDAEGKPQVVYHGTIANTHEDALGFNQFLTKYFELGSHFGTTAQANSFAISDQGTGRVMPVYLNMKNPLRLQDQGGFDAMDIAPQLLNMGFIDEKQAEALQEMPIDDALVAMQEAIKANGHDGIVYLNRREGMSKATLKSLMQIPFSEQNAMSDEAFKKVARDASDSYIVFDPSQIKSAVGNNGNFDPNDPSILHQSEITKKDTALSAAFKAITSNDEVFQYPISQSRDLQQIFNDIAPGLVQVDQVKTLEGDDTQTYKVNPLSDTGAVQQDNVGFVTVFPDGKVEVNVLNLGEGKGGSAVYAAVSNFAYNNALVFAGDREGITSTGSLGRLENMISTALKFGTTDHIAPHPQQAQELGIDWQIGNTEHNLDQMLQASYKAVTEGTYVTENQHGFEVTYKSQNATGVAKVKDIVYDVETKQFKDTSNGKPYTDTDFGRLAKTEYARRNRAGSTTLKRAAIANTVLAQPRGEARNRLVAGFIKLARQPSLLGSQLEDSFYQNKSNTNTRGSFSPSSNTITLLKNADLSTFLHELGHSFLEMDVNLAAQLAGNTQLTEGEQEILNDVGSLFNWFGLQGNVNAQLDQWYAMSIDEQRTYHEKMAEGFESYLFEGKAPSIELQPLFQRMRAWFMHVYRNLSKYLSDAGETLTPEVRSVFDRMLASTEQIKLSQQARSMLPLFETADQAGMTPDEFAAYQRLDPQATQDAIAELQSRGLRDMKWLSNARAKQLKKLQKEADGLRREVRSEVTTEIMSQPVYRAWTFLTAKLSADDKITPGIRLKSDPNEVDETQDNLFTAIAKLGGINKDAAISEWGVDPRDNPQSGVFGKPVLRKNGGLSLDAMAELLAERGYLPVDKNGKHDIRDLDERYSEQARGNKQVSQAYDYSQDQAPIPGAGLNTDGLKAGRLDRGALAATYGTAEGSRVSALNTLRMTSVTGLHPDIVAEMFGFSSGDQLVKALLDAQPSKQAVEDATDTRMLERHGDLSSPEALGRAADKAIHNDVRARMISTELNALAKATGKKATLAFAAREFATAMIARIKVRNIKPNQYAVAEAKAAKNAAAAMHKSDLETAAAEKRNQLVNNYATKAALNARDEIDQGVAYLRKFGSDGVRKSIDVDYLDQIDAMLERFDLRTGVSLKALDKRTALLEWMSKQLDQGLEPDIPPELMNEAMRMSYKDMSLEAFRGLVDSVKQIDHLGRLKNRLLTAKDQRTYEAIRDTITTSIIENAGDRKANTRTPTTNTGRALQGLKNFWASHIKASTWARIMDGGQDGGPVWEYFIRSANEAGDFETTERGKATEALTKVLAPVFALGRMGGKGQYFASIDRSLNRESRMAIALNIGNASNYQRLLGGEGWTAQQVQPVLDALTKAEWDAVQAIWDHFETYRPQIAAKERRVYGKEPNWVEPTAVHTAHGEYRGGYYPIKYDPNASQRAEEHVDAEGAKRQLQGAYTSATTRRSFTKSRVDEVNGRPLLYTLAGVYSGVNDVIHDLAWHEWLIDVNRLMRSSTIDSAIRDHYGPEVKRQLKSWIQDIAEGERGADNAGEMVLGKLRQGVSIAGLGFNVLSAAIQITGFNQSIVRVGAKWIGRGVTKYLASPIQSTREVTEQSEFMADRFRTQFRELNELRNSVQDQSAAKRALQDGAYFMMTRVQQMVDVPTWLGAYEKAISEGNAEERAVSLADQAVIEAQMSGMSKDLSAIERGGPALKLFTVFYSFMNTSLNLGVMKAMTEKKKAKLAADFLLLYVAGPVLGLAIKNALTPGDADDDWDFEALAKALLGESLGFLMGQMVVVREFAEAGKNAFGLTNGNFGYQGPAGVRVIADTTKFVQQAQQGEFDDAFRKASINLIGPLFGIPAAQVNRSITGINALTDGKTDNPASAILGYQEPH